MPSYLIKRRPDANHAIICEALRKYGISVIDLADAGEGYADICVHGTETTFIEIKVPGGSLRRKQVHFLATWPGHCGIATTVEEALQLARDPHRYALKNWQKESLLKYYATMTAKEVRLNTILKVINLESQPDS